MVHLLGLRLLHLHHLPHLHGLLLLHLLLQILLCLRCHGVVERLHLPPEQDQRLQIGRVAERPGLQVHPRFLPHGLPVVGQGRGVVGGEEELIVPVPLSGLVLLQEVPPVELLIHRVSLVIVGRHRPRLIAVGQFELEHRLKERRVGRVFHHALALQPSGALRRGKFLCLPAGGCPIRPALETVGNSDDLPRLLIDLRQIRHVLLDITLQRVNPDHGHVCRAVRPQGFHVLGVVVNVRRRRQRHKTAGFQQLVQDFCLQPVGAVLLVGNLVQVGVAQEFPVDADVFLQNHRVNVRLVVRHAHRLLHRHRHRQSHGVHHGLI